MSSISEANRTIAKSAAQAFGGSPRVSRYWDDNHVSFIDLLTCEDRPQKGVNSYSTIGLSDCPLVENGKEYSVRLEIVGACADASSHYENALATAAFCVMNSKQFCYPGAVFRDVLSMYKCSETMRHFLFVPPFPWEDHLQTLDLGKKKVAWLLAVPISEEERRFTEETSPERLEDLFVDRQIDIFNLERPSEV